MEVEWGMALKKHGNKEASKEESTNQTWGSKAVLGILVFVTPAW